MIPSFPVAIANAKVQRLPYTFGITAGADGFGGYGWVKDSFGTLIGGDPPDTWSGVEVRAFYGNFSDNVLTLSTGGIIDVATVTINGTDFSVHASSSFEAGNFNIVGSTTLVGGNSYTITITPVGAS